MAPHTATECPSRSATTSTDVQNHYHVHELRRWPLGTPYTAVIADVGRLVAFGDGPYPDARIYFDATGVGAAVEEMVMDAYRADPASAGPGASPSPPGTRSGAATYRRSISSAPCAACWPRAVSTSPLTSRSPANYERS